MALIRVTASQLRAKAEELSGLNRQFETQAGELEACEQKLSGMWDGQAKDAFHQAFARNADSDGKFFVSDREICQHFAGCRCKV